MFHLTFLLIFFFSICIFFFFLICSHFTDKSEALCHASLSLFLVFKIFLDLKFVFDYLFSPRQMSFIIIVEVQLTCMFGFLNLHIHFYYSKITVNTYHPCLSLSLQNPTKTHTRAFHDFFLQKKWHVHFSVQAINSSGPVNQRY